MFEYLCANGSLSACVTALKFGSWQSAALFCSVFRYCGIAVSAQCSLKVKQLALRVRWSNERYVAANTQHWNHTESSCLCAFLFLVVLNEAAAVRETWLFLEIQSWQNCDKKCSNYLPPFYSISCELRGREKSLPFITIYIYLVVRTFKK